jgi:thiamine-phosphate diphosphorylase
MEKLRSPVYVIVNYTRAEPETARRIVRACLEGGAGLIQFRAKEALEAADVALLRQLTADAHSEGVPMVANDLVGLAREVEARGVHVGPSDEGVAVARTALGADAIVGATAPTAETARLAQSEGASYVGVGAMYPSPTKPERPVVGPARLREVAAAVTIPVCAIGGITADRVPELLEAGADLLCVISAVAADRDPVRAVRDLVKACVT